MAIRNNTYNFYQPDMNFGQSILRGAFGSITGNCMGMDGSIYNIPGVCGGGYGIGGYSDAAVGAQIGGMLSNIFASFITHAFDGRGGIGGGKEENARTDAEDKVETLESELKELNNKNTDEYVNKNLDSKFDANITSAKNTKIKLEASKTTINSNLIALKGQYDSMPETTEEEKAAKQKFKKEKIDPQQAELDKLNADKDTKGSIAEAEEKIKEAEQAKEKEINRIKAENQKAISAKEEELKIAQEALDKIIDEERIKNNNRNAKLEAKCDKKGEVDNNQEVEKQSTSQGKFNRAYEIFKKDPSKINFKVLVDKFDEIKGNKKCFRHLLESIIKQHPEFKSLYNGGN